MSKRKAVHGVREVTDVLKETSEALDIHKGNTSRRGES